MKLLMISLGCDKNLVDTENMLGRLQQDGHTFTDLEQEAEAVIVNTCCFIGDAKEESINTILEMARLKENGRCRALIVTGCLAQRYRQEIYKEIPEVDGIVGTAAWDEISQVLEQAEKGERPLCVTAPEGLPGKDTERILTTGGHYAFLKIAEGCDKHCTYCIIPKVRGNYRSIPMEDLLKEAEELAEKGVKELILVAQETTLYGSDLYGKKTLPLLLKKLCKIEGIEWIRVLYCYPEEITEELIQVIKEEDKICNYLDIPVQSGSDAVLKRMGRRTNAAQIKQIIGTLREQIPDICIRTTLIAGFPGETDEDHENTLNFVNEMEFDRLGVFTYSEEEDTPAAEMPDQVEETIKEKRRNEIMELQQEIAFDAAGEMTGRKVKAMIEGRMEEENVYVARTYKDAPGIDGYLFINSKGQFLSGDFVEAVITASNEYDLIGEIDAGSAELEDK